MKTSLDIKKMCITAVLCAVGILIPVISPVKINLGPMTFTLASHVALFIAIFISPYTAIFVTLGTTVGFVLAGFPIVVVARAFSHIVFAVIGAYILKKDKDHHVGIGRMILLGVILSLIHGVCEALVVAGFYFGGIVSITGTFMYGVVYLVGGGTFIHSMIDYALALLIWRAVFLVIDIPASYIPQKKRNV